MVAATALCHRRYQNDDYGKDYLKGLKEALGDNAASMIVAEEAYDVTEATVDSHVIKMKSLNADVFVNIATSKFAAQAIRKAAEIGWKRSFLTMSRPRSVWS